MWILLTGPLFWKEILQIKNVCVGLKWTNPTLHSLITITLHGNLEDILQQHWWHRILFPPVEQHLEVVVSESLQHDALWRFTVYTSIWTLIYQTYILSSFRATPSIKTQIIYFLYEILLPKYLNNVDCDGLYYHFLQCLIIIIINRSWFCFCLTSHSERHTVCAIRKLVK